MNKEALFSEDRKHRYWLSRTWGPGPYILYIGYNPSNANEQEDDPTIMRLMGFTRKFGYMGFYIVNLFTQVTQYPKLVRVMDDTQRDMRNYYIRQCAKECDKAVYMYGTCGATMGEEEKSYIPEMGLFCFGINKNGSPKHPLYLPNKTELVPFKPFIKSTICP